MINNTAAALWAAAGIVIRGCLQDEVVVTISASLASDNESFVRKLFRKIATNFGCKSRIVSDVIDGFR